MDACPRTATDNFKFKNYLFGAKNIVKNSDKEEWMYSGCEITFDSTGSWNFANEFAWTFILLGVNNNSLFHVDNGKNDFLVLSEGLTYGIKESFGSALKKFSNNFSKKT